MDLIRKMVLAIEDAPSGFARDQQFEGYTPAQVGYHAYLLVDAGLARGIDVTTMSAEAPQVLITSLTWAGHEFAQAARDDTRWNRMWAIVREKGVPVTFEIAKQLLLILMKERLGIP